MNSAVMKEKNTDLKLFSEKELGQLNRFRFPQHVAIVMDGNRRWAKKHQLPPLAGHWQGAEALATIVRAAGELDIKTLTVYAFSTENWKRTPEEVASLLHLFITHLIGKKDLMIEEGVRLNVIGDITKFPNELKKTLEETLKATDHGKRLNLVIALNYGGRDELRRAIKAIAQDCVDKKLSQELITEEIISNYLDTAPWKDPDLLIRTSGENRVSNFLLWQISYSEIIVTDTLWPDFNEKDLLKAILEYQRRELRTGK